MDPLTAIYHFVTIHPITAFLLAGAYVTFVGSLDAPTKDSKQWYKSMFAVLNFLSLQFKRMYPKVESSPNFTDAVEKHCDALNGGAK